MNELKQSVTKQLPRYFNKLKQSLRNKLFRLPVKSSKTKNYETRLVVYRAPEPETETRLVVYRPRAIRQVAYRPRAIRLVVYRPKVLTPISETRRIVYKYKR